MNFGETFRIIRKQRGISLQKIAGTDISFSALATFERGECMISFELLIILLKKLQLSLDEFYSLCQKSRRTDYDIFAQKAAHFLHTGDSEGLEKLAQVEEAQFQATSFDFHKHNAIICKVLQSMIAEDEQLVTSKEADLINDYLWAVEIWTKYDLSLLNYTLPVIPLASFPLFMNEIWQSLPDDFLTDKLHSYKFNLINSMISMLIDHGKFNESEAWIKKVKARLADSQDFFQMTYLYMLELLLEKRRNPSDQTEQKYQTFKEILRKIGAETHAQHFDREWKST